jgi:hypothetical protein
MEKMALIMIKFDSETILMVETDADRDCVINAQCQVGEGQYEDLREALVADGFKVGAFGLSDIVIDWS